MTQSKVRIGKIVGCHGVRGDVKVRPASDDAGWTESARTLFIRDPKTGEDRPLTLKSARHQGPLVVLHFSELESRTLAEPLIGAILYADRGDLPEPDEDEYWADDLIGLTVIDAQTGRKRGLVKDLLSSGGSDFLEIQLEDSAETVVIPFINHFFPTVNTTEGTISVDLLSDFLSIAKEPVTQDKLEE